MDGEGMWSSRWERYQQLPQTGEECHSLFETEKFFTADELSHKIYMYDGVCIDKTSHTLGCFLNSWTEYDAIADVEEK